MKIAKIPKNEPGRIRELQSLKILDSLSESEYDLIVSLASEICKTPIALVSLVDNDRQWFKATVGLNASETPRDFAFCAHAILGNDLFIVEDAQKDSRFHDNPLVTESPHVRFYAGAPLTMKTGHSLGTLCIIDTIPRSLLPEQKTALTALSKILVSLLEARREVQLYARNSCLIKQMLEENQIPTLVVDEHGDEIQKNSAFESFFGGKFKEHSIIGIEKEIEIFMTIHGKSIILNRTSIQVDKNISWKVLQFQSSDGSTHEPNK